MTITAQHTQTHIGVRQFGFYENDDDDDDDDSDLLIYPMRDINKYYHHHKQLLLLLLFIMCSYFCLRVCVQKYYYYYYIFPLMTDRKVNLQENNKIKTVKFETVHTYTKLFFWRKKI